MRPRGFPRVNTLPSKHLWKLAADKPHPSKTSEDLSGKAFPAMTPSNAKPHPPIPLVQDLPGTPIVMLAECAQIKARHSSVIGFNKLSFSESPLYRDWPNVAAYCHVGGSDMDLFPDASRRHTRDSFRAFRHPAIGCTSSIRGSTWSR